MRTPASRHAIIAPTANTSLVATTAVGRGSTASKRRIMPAAAARSIGPNATWRSSSARPASASAARMPAPRSVARSLPSVTRAQQAEAAMAEADQVARHREGGGAVVEADAGMLAHRIDAPGQHVGPAVVLQQREQRRIVVQADEHEGVDAAAQQLLGDAQLGAEVVVVLGQHQRVAVAVEHRLQRAGGARVERVVERRHDGADHAAACAAQRARRAVRHVAQLRHGVAHARPRLGVDLLGRVEHARHGGGRNAGEPRDVLGAGAMAGTEGDFVARSERSASRSAEFDYIWSGKMAIQ